MSTTPRDGGGSSVEALAARSLVEAGLEVHDVNAGVVEVGRPGAPRRATLSLGSLRRVLAMTPPGEHPARARAWASAAAASLGGETPPGPIEDRLVPRLFRDPDPRLWSQPIAQGLHIAVAEDLPGRQRLLTLFDLPRLGISVAGLRRLAARNLARSTPPPERLDLHRGALCWRVGDGLDAARLLLLGEPPLKTLGSFAVVPARDLCWWVPISGARSVRAGVALWSSAQRLGAIPYPLSPRLWWVRAGGIEAVDLREERGVLRVGLPAELARALSS